jgi:acetyl-CoA carboxylase biotin carboxyl carrier protein
MDLSLVKKLIKLFEDSKISELEVEENEFKIKLSKKSESPHIISQVVPAAAHIQSHAGGAKSGGESAESKEGKSGAAGTDNLKFHEICSPIVGTFYRSPSPDTNPYVEIGDRIQKGTVLCIVEAMKLMNEIESDVSGKVIRILVENGKPVEYNQPLFVVETD